MSLRSRTILIAGFLLVAVVCVRLGFWQTDRLRERRAANSAARAARSQPIVTLGGNRWDTTLTNQRIRVRGRYDHSHDLVLRGRQYRGVPGVEIVSPLLPLGGNTAVLVNRGFVPAPDAFTVASDSFAEAGVVTVEGIALPIDSGHGAPVVHGQLITWARLDRAALTEELPYPVYPLYLRQSPDSALPRFPRRLEPPGLDDGPHLAYAIQWFSFAVIALVFAGVIAMRRGP
jgi:surfeit locus 1 family protein